RNEHAAPSPERARLGSFSDPRQILPISAHTDTGLSPRSHLGSLGGACQLPPPIRPASTCRSHSRAAHCSSSVRWSSRRCTDSACLLRNQPCSAIRIGSGVIVRPG